MSLKVYNYDAFMALDASKVSKKAKEVPKKQPLLTFSRETIRNWLNHILGD